MKTDKLKKDKFGIPILPSDSISEDGEGNLNAMVYVFTDITQGDEKYESVKFNSIPKTRVLPPFTYIKPDSEGKDPRDINNIVYIDEKEKGKVREKYVLLGLIPSTNCDFEKAWGMRNHLHKPITKANPGIVCAVYDASTNSWSTRTYFESDSIKFLNGYDVKKMCYRILNKSKIKDWEKALIELVGYLKSIGIDDFQLISSGLHYVYGAKVYPYDIDIFTSRLNVKQAYSLLKDFAISDLHEFKDQTGSYLEFQGEINGIPFELCEWNHKSKKLVDIDFKGHILRGLSLKDEIETYDGKDRKKRVALLKSVDIRIEQAQDLLTENEVIHQMRENLHTKEGKISNSDDFDETYEELKLAFKEGRGYVAMDSYDNPVGYVSWIYHDKDHRYVSDAIFIAELYVFPEHRMRGIGKKLIENVLKDKSVAGQKIWLTHDPDELGLSYFYQRLGFEEQGKTDAGNVIMIRDRNPRQ
jgi:ribosomal protein S18 acetylase RimI-like enzyme